MRVGILGPLEVLIDDRPITVGGARLRGLLVRLAVDAGHFVSVAAVTDALWPDDPPGRPQHAVQSLVSRLRRALAPIEVRSAPAGYRLELAPDAVDAHRFERLVTEARREPDRLRTATLLRNALALWRGPALVDVAALPYAAASAARLEELRACAWEDVSDIELDQPSAVPGVIVRLEELVVAYPFRERLRALQIQALHRAGRDSEALTVYERYRRMVRDELGADPGPQVRSAHLGVLRGEPVLTPTPPRAATRPIRVPLTGLIGRDQELARIEARMRGSRLVTLVGPGGAGKTRLAVEIAQRAVDYPGGIGLAELAPVSDADDLIRAVRAGFDIGDPPHPGPGSRTELLAATLPTAATLLILDNCEHLADAAARFAEEILARCPALRILVTSREPLGVSGEVLCQVPALALPATGAPDAADSPAVRLFAERAASVRDDFRLTDDVVELVAAICRRLDGLPLAIELAAAKLRTMPLPALADGLDHRFAVLTAGTRTALPRHRTLRAVLDWDWELLDPLARYGLARLTVFAGAIDPEAARAVGVEFGTIETLVGKSLLHLIDHPSPRYRMLETVREYGRRRLDESGETTATLRAHAEYFRDLAEQAQPQLRGAGQMTWLRRLSDDRDNLDTALRFCCTATEPDSAARIGAALGMFWGLCGMHTEAAQQLRVVVDIPVAEPGAAQADLAAAYLLHSILAGNTDAIASHEPILRRFAGPAESRGASGDFAMALLEFACGRVDVGLAVVQPWLDDPDPWIRAMFWLARSFLHTAGTSMSDMEHDLTASATAFGEAGERWGTVTALTFLAFVRATIGDFHGATEAMERALVPARELRLDGARRAWLTMVRIHTGDLTTARTELTEILAGPAPSGETALAHLLMSDLARIDGDLDEAARQVDSASTALARGFADRAQRAMLDMRLGLLHTARGELGTAAEHCRAAWEQARAMHDPPMAAEVSVAVARLCYACGDPRAAAQVLGAGHAIRDAGDPGNPDIASLTTELTDQLGYQLWSDAYDSGSALTPDAAYPMVERHLADACERSASVV
ncbi:BTAD domain-containing putative transcriptional regulator [Nocardia sp. NPDC101769]|uniref:BTAD domain-containing putative transcriptional regulator n=1 Tax=Nocardia sp. NPDC101769 TaxID=3364333 RepID=UPI0038246866